MRLQLRLDRGQLADAHVERQRLPARAELGPVDAIERIAAMCRDELQ